MDSKLDVSSAYPSSQIALNLARDTTLSEVCSIEGVDHATQRKIGLNLSGGHANASRIGRELFNLPSISEYEEGFKEYLKQKELDKEKEEK